MQEGICKRAEKSHIKSTGNFFEMILFKFDDALCIAYISAAFGIEPIFYKNATSLDIGAVFYKIWECVEPTGVFVEHDHKNRDMSSGSSDFL